MVKINYTDGTILSGAMINSDYKDLLGKIVIPSNIHGFSFGSDGMIGSNINHFPDSMKCIGITLTTTGGTSRWESPKAVVLASGNYVGPGSSYGLYTIDAGLSTRCFGNITFIISGATLNGL